MNLKLKRIAPLQAGKLLAAFYGLMALVFVPFMMIFMMLARFAAPAQASAGGPPPPLPLMLGMGVGFMLLMPILYAVMGFIFGVLSADTLIFSKQKGKAGTWEKIADVTELGGVTFTPEGVLYFGDDDFSTKGLFKVSALGEKPTQVQNEIRVTCLKWDDAKKRLLGCSNNYHFGSFDTETGKLTPRLDLRCAEHAVACADKPDIQEQCAPPTIEYCKIDHWVAAPLCKVYDRGADCATYATAQGFTCEAGHAVSTDGGVASANADVCMQPVDPQLQS